MFDLALGDHVAWHDNDLVSCLQRKSFLNIRFPYVILLCSLLLGACSAVKRVPDGEHLLVKNKLHLGKTSVSKGELRQVIKQQPNKKILWLRFHLSMYNWPDPEKLAVRREKQATKRAERNEKRKRKGKDVKTYKRVKGEWLQDVVGEAPVILDPDLTEKSRGQLEVFLAKKGYFRSEVSDSTIYPSRKLNGKPKKKKAIVVYNVRPGPAFKINKLEWHIHDDRLERYRNEDAENSLVKTGDVFDTDILEKERQRLTRHFQNLGLFYFTKDHITVEADSTVGGSSVNLTFHIHNERVVAEDGHEIERPHQVYYLDQLSIDTDFRPTLEDQSAKDSIEYNDVRFLYLNKLRYKPKLLLRSVIIKEGDRYKLSKVENTYKRLSSLRVFRSVNMEFDTLNTTRKNGLNCSMKLTPSKERSFGIETNGTNRGGFLGINGSLTFRHNNIFRGTELLTIKFTGGIEAQQSVTQSSSDGETNVDDEILFNTIEFGPEISLQIPKFLLPINVDKFAKSTEPRTIITALYNYQRRPDYTRTLSKVSFGYAWKETKFKSWQVQPVEVSVIKIPHRSQSFIDYLEEVNDPFLTSSYTDHFILGPRIVYTFNNQQLAKPRNVFYYRGSLESAGNILHGIHSLTNRELFTDTLGNEYYESFNIRYAQYLKMDNDARYYRRLHDKSTIVYRLAAGVGIPFKNLDVLPFEKSFYVGGANGLRAWRARSIGPGSYFDPSDSFDKIGEVRIESNIEYRFDLIDVLEGAFFVDAGNIWLLNEDDNKPGSGFSGDFISEIAIGAGVGARLNFDIFLIRFDLAMQLKDPSLPKGERWVFEPKDEYEQDVLDITGVPGNYRPQLNFNLGIGYPF